jgi:hypothetical protein
MMRRGSRTLTLRHLATPCTPTTRRVPSQARTGSVSEQGRSTATMAVLAFDAERTHSPIPFCYKLNALVKPGATRPPALALSLHAPCNDGALCNPATGLV